MSSLPRSSSTSSPEDSPARRTSSSRSTRVPSACRRCSDCVDRGDRGARGLVFVGPEVSVGVEGGLRRGVPQPRLHDLHVEAGGDQQRREVVPKVVKPELGRQTLDLGSCVAYGSLNGPGSGDGTSVLGPLPRRFAQPPHQERQPLWTCLGRSRPVGRPTTGTTRRLIFGDPCHLLRRTTVLGTLASGPLIEPASGRRQVSQADRLRATLGDPGRER